MDKTKKMNYSDWLGASASGLCIVHCALTPLFFTAKPVVYGMIGKHVHHHGMWGTLDYIFLILSLLAVWYSTEHTPHVTLKKILWAAWVVFAFGLLLEPYELPLGHWITYAGSIALVIAHIKNYIHCQKHCSIEVLD